MTSTPYTLQHEGRVNFVIKMTQHPVTQYLHTLEVGESKNSD